MLEVWVPGSKTLLTIWTNIGPCWDETSGRSLERRTNECDERVFRWTFDWSPVKSSCSEVRELRLTWFELEGNLMNFWQIVSVDPELVAIHACFLAWTSTTSQGSILRETLRVDHTGKSTGSAGRSGGARGAMPDALRSSASGTSSRLRSNDGKDTEPQQSLGGTCGSNTSSRSRMRFAKSWRS